MSADGKEQVADGIEGNDPNAPAVTEGAGGGQVTTTSASNDPKPTSLVKLVFEQDKLFANNDKEHDHVFEVTNEPKPVQFVWTLKDDTLEPVNASLIGGEKAEADNLEEIWTQLDLSRFFGSLERTGITMEFDMFFNNPILKDAALTYSEETAKYLALKVHWKTEDAGEGFNVSPYFSVVDGTNSDADSLAEFIQNELDAAGTEASEGWSRVGGTDIIGDGSSQDNGSDENKTEPGGGNGEAGQNEDGGGANAGEGNQESDGGNDDSGSSDGGGGGPALSTGAIAGIAVGGAVFLIAVGVLIWFLLRRRRSKPKNRAEYSQSPDLANDYVSGKDGNDADINSPYSEDGGHPTQQTPLEPSAAARAATATPASYAPYQDQENNHNNNNLARTATNASMSAHSNSPIESIPRSDTHMSNRASQQHRQGVSPRVAHLVEEGMTPEEIQRLEDEERQLDLEIERAGRR